MADQFSSRALIFDMSAWNSFNIFFYRILNNRKVYCVEISTSSIQSRVLSVIHTTLF